MERDNGNLHLMDIHLAAYLQLQGVEPALLKQSGRIVFSFRNSGRVASLIQDYNANPSGIPLLDYVQCLRRLRSQMISLRD